MIQATAEAAPERAVFLSWQVPGGRQWFPVGRLDALGDPLRDSLEYRFRYIGGAERAQEEADYPLTLGFPDIRGDYRSRRIFAVFHNRVISSKRVDFPAYMRDLDLPADPPPDPISILQVSGGRRATDSYEVFPKIAKREDGGFTCRFFLRGLRHVNKAAQARIKSLQKGETLYMTLERTNPATGLAIQIQTEDYHMVGWTPRYIAFDLFHAMAESPDDYRARVVRLNPPPAPRSHRLLIEMEGRWENHEPMSGADYQPLI